MVGKLELAPNGSPLKSGMYREYMDTNSSGSLPPNHWIATDLSREVTSEIVGYLCRYSEANI